MYAMGAIWTRIWGKPSTKDVLDKITAQLGDIEEFKRDTQAWHKKLIGYLLLYFSSLYFLAAAVVYFKFYHDPEWRHWSDQLKLFAPFLVAPLILWLVKRGLTWWYHRKLRKNEEKLDKLREEKTKILEEVMEKETYKVAKEILDKYGTKEEQLKAKVAPAAAIKALPSPSGSDVRRRNVTSSHQRPDSADLNASSKQQQQQQVALSSPAPISRQQQGGSAADMSLLGSPSRQMTMGGPLGGRRPPPGPPLPRPVLPRERGYMDKVVEYLVGDGPSNRFALICKQCQSHNGMALREEFEYIAFRCCYCFYWNPARKQRPTAPRLPAGPPMPAAAMPAAAAGSSTESTDDESTTTTAAAAKPLLSKEPAVKSKADKVEEEEEDCRKSSSSETEQSTSPQVETEVVTQAKETEDEGDKKDD